MKQCNENIRRSLEFARQLTVLADEGEADSGDDGCILLYGIIRDSAYQIRSAAERERAAHRRAGVWEQLETIGA